MNTLYGTVISRCKQRHRPIECRTFVRQIDRETTHDTTPPLLCDYYANHKHPNVKKWLATHPRFHVHVTPDPVFRLNGVERFFRDTTTERLHQGVVCSVPELTAAIKEYITVHHKYPKPFSWTTEAHVILAKVIRANSRLSSKQNEALH